MKALLIAVLVSVSSVSFGEHEGGAIRPEAPSKIKGCGTELGEVVFQHKGRGLFAARTYKLKVSFHGDEQGMDVEYDYGVNRKETIQAGEIPSATTSKNYGKREPCRMYQCETSARYIGEALDKASERLAPLDSIEEKALACAREKLDRFVVATNSYHERQSAKYRAEKKKGAENSRKEYYGPGSGIYRIGPQMDPDNYFNPWY